MGQDEPVDYYEALQISANAEPETIHRVYRLLAQRFHPDNQETGSETRFRQVSQAYAVLSNPEQRARYDVAHRQQQQDRWRIASKSSEVENDFNTEKLLRLTILEVLYTRRRLEPTAPGMFIVDLEKLIGRPREHLEFTVWFLIQKKFIAKSDNSLLVISADGVEFLEDNQAANMQVKRLRAQND